MPPPLDIKWCVPYSLVISTQGTFTLFIDAHFKNSPILGNDGSLFEVLHQVGQICRVSLMGCGNLPRELGNCRRRRTVTKDIKLERLNQSQKK